MLQKVSLKNRFIIIIAVVAAVIFAFVNYSQILVDKSTANTLKTSQNFRDLTAILRTTKYLIRKTESDIYQYYALSGNPLKLSLEKDSKMLSDHLSRLGQEWLRANIDTSTQSFPHLSSIKSETVLEQLQADGLTLLSELNHYLKITSSVESNFPGMKILVDKLLPLNIEFLNQASLAANEDANTTQHSNSGKINAIFEHSRYLWAQQISLLRLFVSNRIGTFGDPLQGMKQNLSDRELYLQLLDKDLEKLSEFDTLGELGFQQSESLASMLAIHKNHQLYFASIKQIYLSDDWRVDLTIIRSRFKPLFKSLWMQINNLESILENYSDYNLIKSDNTASLISIFIWIFAIIIILLLSSSYFFFNKLVRKPILKVVNALDDLAQGDGIEHEIITSSEETDLLVKAFQNMQIEVNSRQTRLESILETAGEGVIIVDERGVIETYNNAAQELFGYTLQEIIGKNISIITPEQEHDKHDQYIKNYQETGSSNIIGKRRELMALRKDKTTFPISLKVTELIIDGKRLYTALIEDISESREMVENLQRLAEHDSLTGLYNRFYFNSELERVVKRTKRNKTSNCALFYIDLDNFKYVNDTQGHIAGDQLLIEVSSLFRSKIRSSDLIARIGGDEFAVIVYDVTEEVAKSVADTLREFMQDYIFIQKGKSINIGCSIGICMFDETIADKDDLLARADFACHAAKAHGRNMVHVYSQTDEKQRHSLSDDIGWAKRIKDALRDDRFLLLKQPIYDVKNKCITKYEVLIRMLDEAGEQVMPGGFLPAAERFGLINEIDKWVVKNSIKELAEYNKSNQSTVYSINISAKSFDNDSVISCITNEIANNQLQASSLIFEITETVAMDDVALTVKFMRKLQKLGCLIALDDFGIGYSSFSHLKSLPVDYVKIDGSFVKDIDKNDVSYAVVKSMNDISHAMGKKTIAEFVETEQCLVLLEQIGVDYAQGYGIGKPCVGI